jgi:hypothetical protein
MIPGTPAAKSRWTVLLATALVVAVVVAVLASAFAAAYYAQLTKISPCDGGIGISAGCPPLIGATFVQLGHGRLAGATYVYTFLAVPDYPPGINPSSLTLRAYSATSDVTLSLLNVTLSSPNGSLLATYHAVSGNWTAATTADIGEVDLLALSSSTNISGEWVSIWDSAASNGVYAPLA